MKKERLLRIYRRGWITVSGLLLWLCVTVPVRAQLPLDSVFFSLSQRPRFFFQLDAANSFVSGSGANAIGFRAGLDFHKRIKFGTGFYTVISDIVENKYVEKYDTFYNAKLQVNYYTTFADLVLYTYERWQFSLQNQLGIGNSYFWYYPNREGNKKKTENINSGMIMLYEPMLSGQFKILKWVGVGFGTGYRIMLVNNKEIDHKLSSPVYAIKLKIFMNEIVNSIWPGGIRLFKKKKTGNG